MQQENQGQIECAKCKKSFRGNVLAERIRCPHQNCHHVNVLNPKQYPSYVKLEVPHPNLAETKKVVEAIFQEDVTGEGWEAVPTSYEHITSLNGRLYCIGDNGNEVWVGVAESAVVPGRIEEVFNVFWDLQDELKWNTTSLKTNELIEQGGNEQVVYQERKTHASISTPADILYRRTFEKWDNFIIAWGKPEVSAKKPPRSGFRRCEIVFMGFQVTRVDNDNCQVAMCSSFHELGNVPALVIQDELKKISLRVSKVIARVQEIRRLAARNIQVQPTSQIQQGMSCGKCGSADGGGKFCASCGNKLR